MPLDDVADYRAQVLDLGNALVALGGACAVFLAIIAGVLLVRQVWGN